MTLPFRLVEEGSDAFEDLIRNWYGKRKLECVAVQANLPFWYNSR
jgi:hypothetical protein